MKVLLVFGTRPEAIKLAPVIAELRQHGEIGCKLCVTGQQREMLDQVLDLFEIVPDYDLNLMQDNQSLNGLTARILEKLEPILAVEQPDWLLVQGDTTTAMAASLAAFYQRTPLAHIEAGLRTRNKFQPFPEEINRRIADLLADIYFAPTPTAKKNLLAENLPAQKIFVSGNTGIDALRLIQKKAFVWQDSPLQCVPQNARVILVTAHRRENFGDGIENLCQALGEIVACRRDVFIVYPVHLNPNVRLPVQRQLGKIPNILLTEPLDYAALVHLIERAEIILTDSGGLQEEAPSWGKPVLVVRAVTERPEAVEAGTVKIIGTDARRIVAETLRLLNDRAEYQRMARAVNPYGDGHASERIVNYLLGKPVTEFAG